MGRYISPVQLARKEETTTFVDGFRYLLPEPTTAIELDFRPLTGSPPPPSSKNDPDVYGHLHINIDGTRARIPTRLEIQGASTKHAAEKNWNLKFYESISLHDHHGDKRWVKIGNAVAARKFMWKSGWIEVTKAHNYMWFKMWEQAVNARSTYPMYAADNGWLRETKFPQNLPQGGKGFDDVWPAVFYFEGEFYGIANLMTTKDWYIYNMPRKDASDPATIWRGHPGSTKSWSSHDGSHDFQARVPDIDQWDNERMNNVNRLCDFVMGNRDDFHDDIDSYIDLATLIDWTLFTDFTMDWDGMKEVMMVTYDGQKWFPLPYDKDTTFGSYWKAQQSYGSRTDPTKNYFTQYKGTTGGSHALIGQTFKHFVAKLETRYAELRDKSIFSAENVMYWFKRHESFYTKDQRQRDMDKWKDSIGIGGQTDGGYKAGFRGNDGAKLLSWINDRISHCDSYYNYNP